MHVCACVFQIKKPGHYPVAKLEPLKILGQEDIGELWRYGGKDWKNGLTPVMSMWHPFD